MKRPPPITEFYRFPITAGLAMLAIFVTVVGALGRSTDRLVMNVQAFEGEPFRLVTSTLPHADAMHLLFNVAWLWVFGTALEQRFGPIRPLFWMLIFAVGSSAAEYAIFVGGIGLSGVVYGLFGLLWVLSRTDVGLLDTIDKRTSLLFVTWFFLCIATTVLGIWPVANVAHAVGWLLGLLVGIATHGGSRFGRSSSFVRWANILGVVGVLGVSLAGASHYRRLINFASHGGADSARLANQAFEDGHFDEAIVRYRAAIEISPKVPSNWYNLGVTYTRQGDYEAAAKAFEQACELAPESAEMKKAAADTSRYLAYMAQSRGEYAQALLLYQDALTRGREDAPTLFNMSLVYKALGLGEESRKVLSRAAKLDPAFEAYLGDESAPADAGVDDAASE